jgi:DNA-binding transcriptional MerR regulator
MLKIGEFSRLSQVTVKTLHHYDEIGLFKPSHVDKFTDYRYYTIDQLPYIHSIMALKELGLSLEEIAQLMQENLPPEQIRGMFRLKQAEAQQRVREEQARLAQIEFRLRQIEREGMMQTVDVVIKRIEPIYALTLRRVFRTAQEREAASRAITQAVADGLIMYSGGTPMALMYQHECEEDISDSEMCLPVDSSHTPTVSLGEMGTLTLRELPGIESAATYIHQGSTLPLNEKNLFLQRWVLENGYKLSGVWRILFHRAAWDNVPSSEYMTELQHPIERA